jgi:hypothetical protein
MPKFRALITDYAWEDTEIERKILADGDVELIVADKSDAESLKTLVHDHQVDAIMTNWAQVPEEVIVASSNVKIVARMGIGLDNIDVAYCTKEAIPVTNIPDYCLIEVAEHGAVVQVQGGPARVATALGVGQGDEAGDLAVTVATLVQVASDLERDLAGAQVGGHHEPDLVRGVPALRLDGLEGVAVPRVGLDGQGLAVGRPGAAPVVISRLEEGEPSPAPVRRHQVDDRGPLGLVERPWLPEYGGVDRHLAEIV